MSDRNRSKLKTADTLTKLMFRLLPVQILLAMVGAVNGIVSGLFASNFVGVEAMSAVTLYGPIGTFIGAVGGLLFGGATILCGKYLGQNEQDRVSSVFTLDLLFAGGISLVFTLMLLVMGIFNLTGFFTKDAALQPIFCSYLMGQAIGILPTLLGNQFSAFLSLENQTKRTTIASIVYIVVNILLNFIFVMVLRMEAFGLALASSLGMWIFLLVQAQYFLTDRASLHFGLKSLQWSEGREIIRVGLPGALGSGYQTVRGIIVNKVLAAGVGSVALSAFGACNGLLNIFWAIPAGMLAVSRMMISISVGEEDRQNLTDTMRVMLKRFVPLMCGVSAIIILCAPLFTRMYFRDTSEAVYRMTMDGFRILPLSMPLSIICAHYVCYGQSIGKHVLVHILSILDGMVFVSAFTVMLVKPLGMNSVYVANVLNGAGCILVILIYACIAGKRIPRDMDGLLALPEDFGVPEDARMDISISGLEEVVRIAEKVQQFCLSRGVDQERAYYAALALEEMAGNIVDHGFTRDLQEHMIDARVAHKDDGVILRIKDDCVPFDPGAWRQMTRPEDPSRNIGIRVVFETAREVQYQNILGLNVLTVRL